MGYDRELTVALRAAKEAGAVQLARAKKLPRVELKADASPVTDVDRKCEALIRRRLVTAFPRDGFMGEETPRVPGTNGRQWIVDPLDGTRPYLRGIPTYSVLIALEEKGDPVVGVIHLPAMAITCWASHGGGAFCNGTRIRVSRVSSFTRAIGTAFGFVEKAGQKAGQPQGKRLLKLMRSWNYAYGFMDAYSYVCVASGKLDIAVNLLDKPWDCASAACIVREAGGKFSDIKGISTVHGGSIVLSNGNLHKAALRFFNPR
ncbi:MAG: inositol monophosphatase [Chitinispirillaceae bacterium]|jgi:histidinol phosphatase-like enzyme (inositol monophosphatase family)